MVLDVKSKPVDRKIRILRALLGTDMTVNNIFIQTGLSYKKPITDAITELEEAQVIGERKDPKHSQKRIKYLTESGKEVADMIISLDEYANSIYELHKVANEKVLFIKGRYLDSLQFENKEQKFVQIRKDYQNALRVVGWQDCEIEFYNYCRTNIVDLIFFCEKNFINVLLLRYSMILRFFKLNNTAKIIVKEIITAAIDEKVSFMLENIEDQIYGYSTIRILNPLRSKMMPTIIEEGSSNGIFQLFRNIVERVIENPLPFVIKEEIRNVLISYLSLLNPPLTNLDLYIWNLTDLVRDNKTHFLKVQGVKDEGKSLRFEKLLSKGLYFFLETYKEYCVKRNFDCVYLNDPYTLSQFS